MPSRRSLLAALPSLLVAGGAAARMMAPVPPDRLAALDDICRPRALRTQYMQGADAADAAAADADLMQALGLLEGHMMIGRALVEAGETRLGLPHFGHPVQELYTWLEPRIAARGAKPFEAELAALETTARGGATGAALDAAYAAALAGVASLRGTVARDRAADSGFRLGHVATMIEAVADDYGESIERGRIVNVLEYHDSAGFLRYAIAVARAGATEAGPAAPWGAVLDELVAVRDAAYAQLMPPTRPPVSIAAIRARAVRVRALASQV